MNLDLRIWSYYVLIKNVTLPHDADSYIVNSVLVVLLHIEELSQFVKNSGLRGQVRIFLYLRVNR